jgi:hypothetical protein
LIGEKEGGAYELNLKLLGRLSVLKQELIVQKIVPAPLSPPSPQTLKPQEINFLKVIQ